MIRSAPCNRQPTTAPSPTMPAPKTTHVDPLATFAEPGLHELEVGEARQAEAPAERQPDDQLGPEQAEQPPPAGRDREHGQDADRRLVEPGSARVDHVEIAIWVGSPLHFPKYCELARAEVSPNVPWVRQTWTEYCFQMGREGVGHGHIP